MLDHRTAAAAGAPPAPRPAAVSFTALSVADSACAFRLQVTVRGRRVRVARHDQSGCACGCRGAWGAHLVDVELLRLRVQTRTPGRRVA